MKDNADILCGLWNQILLNNKIQVCVDELAGLGLLDVKVMKLAYLNPDYKIKQYLEIFKVPNSTFTNIINRLAKRELLSRRIDESDLRSFGLSLTKKGKEAIEKHFQEEKKLFDSLLLHLEEGEQDMFVTLFAKLVDEKGQESEKKYV